MGFSDGDVLTDGGILMEISQSLYCPIYSAIVPFAGSKIRISDLIWGKSDFE